MTKLEQEMSDLRRLFEPWNTASGDTVIWQPEEADPHHQFKREMIGKAGEVIAAGENALAGRKFTVPRVGQPDFETIEASLATDADQNAFLELAVACDRVSRSLAQVAV